MKRATEENITLTTGQAARLLGCTYNTVKAMCRRGKLTGHKNQCTGTWEIDLTSVQELLKTNGAGAPAAKE